MAAHHAGAKSTMCPRRSVWLRTAEAFYVPEHPLAMGWRDPTHVIANRADATAPPADADVVVAGGSGEIGALRSEPPDHTDADRHVPPGLDSTPDVSATR